MTSKECPRPHQHTHKPNTYSNEAHIALDLLIIRKPSNLEIDIFRKPTTTDTTLNLFSNHPIKHKVAGFRCHITRMHSLALIPERKQKMDINITNRIE